MIMLIFKMFLLAKIVSVKNIILYVLVSCEIEYDVICMCMNHLL